MLNKELTASRGIDMSKYVQSVNGVTPDDSGNVEVNATPPSISVGATTLAAGSTATVTKTGTDEAPVFTFGIPKGDKGDKGDTGATGPQGPAGALSALYTSNKKFGNRQNESSNMTTYGIAVTCDIYGRLTGASLIIQAPTNCSTD